MEQNVVKSDWKCTHLQESEQESDTGKYDIYGNGTYHYQSREVYLADDIIIEVCARCYAALETYIWDNR